MGEFRPSRPGERRGGRKKGTPNQTTRDLRQAIMRAMEETGDPEDDFKGGAVGYLKFVARTNTATFGALIGRILPAKVEIERTITLEDLILGAHRAREAEQQALGAEVDAGPIIEGQIAEGHPAAISGPAKNSKP